jgi:GrpB-like predicted nucleotidyltransferase (UPF0157 family)
VIEIVPYDSAWPARFDAEAAQIRGVLGARVLRVDHVGSTSVIGLAAKPVIDIQVSVATLANFDGYSQPLARLGYTHVPMGDFDLVYPFFQKPKRWPSSHHVHLCVAGGEQERRHLAFRDYLRLHPEVAARYAELKRGLALIHIGNTKASRERYSLAKTEFINSVLKRALGGSVAADE